MSSVLDSVYDAFDALLSVQDQTFIWMLLLMMLIIVVFAIVAVVYIVRIYVDNANESLLKNTTNIETTKYTAARSCDLSLNNRYAFIVFPILAIVFLICCITAWIRVFSDSMQGFAKLNSTMI